MRMASVPLQANRRRVASQCEANGAKKKLSFIKIAQ
jgi:hypothetical protein